MFISVHTMNLMNRYQKLCESNDFHPTILSKVFNEKRGYILFYKWDIITVMKMKSICGHSNSEGEETPPVELIQ